MLEIALRFAERVPPSLLSFHDGECCREARAWFLNMDRWLYPRNRALPAWINQRYRWGPSRWPIFWCEAVRAKTLDCGAQSALALEAFGERGVLALSCQIVRKFDTRSILQWRASWEGQGCGTEWAVGEYAYHETCAIVRGNTVEVWDPSNNEKVRFTANPGYGSAVALRLRGQQDGFDNLLWDSLPVSLNEWVRIPAGRNSCPGRGKLGKVLQSHKLMDELAS